MGVWWWCVSHGDGCCCCLSLTVIVPPDLFITLPLFCVAETRFTDVFKVLSVHELITNYYGFFLSPDSFETFPWFDVTCTFPFCAIVGPKGERERRQKWLWLCFLLNDALSPQNVTLCATQNAPPAFQPHVACPATAPCICLRACVGTKAAPRASSSKRPADTCTWRAGWSSPGEPRKHKVSSI